MSNTAMRLTLRQKPHLDFVIGYPGLIPDGDTQQASLQGTVEVRVQNPVHTQWLKVELKKTEIVQTSKGIRKYFEVSSQLNTMSLCIQADCIVHTAHRQPGALFV